MRGKSTSTIPVISDYKFYQNQHNVTMQLTSNYKYSNYEEEHIFSCRGRPFAVLVSSFLPTPPAALIDYELVRDLKLKMTDIQCKKFSFGGNKLRILGSVSTSVQCVHEGRLIGNHHIRARVVSDLNKTFDTHCIAGDKLRKQLCPTPRSVHDNDDDEEEEDDLNISKCPNSPRARGSKCQNHPTPRASDVDSPRLRDRDHGPHKDASNDGGGTFDVNPGGGTFDVHHGGGGGTSDDSLEIDSDPDDHHGDAVDDVHLSHGCDTPKRIPAKDIADQANFTASKANSYTMVMAFGDADMARTEKEARRILLDHCPCGAVEELEPVFTFTHYDGYLFRFGHGRNKCSRRKCLSQADASLPSNCLFHDQWCYPTGFRYCGPECKGGFCPCLENYPSQDGNYF